MRAELLDSAGSPFAVPVGFTASLLSASRTTYAPSAACPDLAGATSIQEGAIDQAAARPAVATTYHTSEACPGSMSGVLGRGAFLEGLHVFFDRPMTPPDGSPHGWFLVSIEYDRREFEADPTEIFVRRINASDVEFVDDDTAVIFRPFDSFVNWANQTGVSDEVLCRVVLKCHVLADHERRVLDGDFLRADLPSGDGTPGGDFESWFSATDPRRVSTTLTPGLDLCPYLRRAEADGVAVVSGPIRPAALPPLVQHARRAGILHAARRRAAAHDRM